MRDILVVLHVVAGGPLDAENFRLQILDLLGAVVLWSKQQRSDLFPRPILYADAESQVTGVELLLLFLSVWQEEPSAWRASMSPEMVRVPVCSRLAISATVIPSGLAPMDRVICHCPGN